MVRLVKRKHSHYNYPYFAGVPVQRGRGLGGVLASLGRAFIPIAKRTVLPLARNVLKKIGKEAISQAPSLIENVIVKKKPIKRAFKDSAKQATLNLISKKKKTTKKRKPIGKRKRKKTLSSKAFF
jgi:hypothetical protein